MQIDYNSTFKEPRIIRRYDKMKQKLKKKLVLCFILLALGIALWIYTKKLKTDNTDNV